MKKIALISAILLTSILQAQDAPSPVVQLSDILHRSASGHSPTPEEIQAIEAGTGLADAKIAHDMVPLLNKALADPDAAIRHYALSLLVGIQSLPDVRAASDDPKSAPASANAQPAPDAATTGPAAYKPDVAKAFAPVVPAIAARLAEDDQSLRLLAATDLGGFYTATPPSIYPPLLAYLKRDDAIGQVGLAVVSDLFQLGPISDESASAISRYLRRSDQTNDARANLIEAIAAKPNQNQLVNKALLTFLDSDDPSLRARTILSLPQLDLTPDVYAELHARVEALAAGQQDSLPVVNAAKSVVTCWTQVKMLTGCPQY